MTVILSAQRTPVGSFGGTLSTLTSTQLGSTAIAAAIQKAGVNVNDVSEVIMGCVLTSGVGQAPARQAALGAGLPDYVPCTTLGKVCGSGMKAVMMADQAIRSGDSKIVVAGGMESMSNAPYLLAKARYGYKMGDGVVIDSMMNDGLVDAYDKCAMGIAADSCAVSNNISRELQDEFTIQSYTRAQFSIANGVFKDEICSVIVKDRKGDIIVDKDEEPAKTNFDKIPTLKPVFTKDGTVTAANASKINDGGAALVLASEDIANELGLKPIAKIIAQAQHAQKPMEFTTAPIGAIEKVLTKSKLSIDDIDLFEINEAFAVVALAAKNALGIPNEKLNVNGGAVAIGHPIGASGARILTTLIYALKLKGLKRGLAGICIGGGEATAIIIEMM
ncbi:MAG: thiolase family protein [Chlorobiota bacterium]|nr:thiolase family protein [Chlorobiota bacterium]QQS66221.1 MAG: thiolase family protein [Chlorobiota bacterium]